MPKLNNLPGYVQQPYNTVIAILLANSAIQVETEKVCFVSCSKQFRVGESCE
jgi:hypothetical protein